MVFILDSNGALVVEYRYDAWGKPIATTGNLADTLGKRNPFRYRGYIYDEETGLYYLRSRYYNPIVGRFVNADTRLEIHGFGSNQFVYCGGNPIVRTDDNGYAWYNNVWDWASNTTTVAWSWTKQAANDAWSWTGQAASDAWNWTKRAASDAWNWTKQAATDAWNWTKQTAKVVWQGISTAAKAVSQFVYERFSTPEKASNTLNGLGVLFESITIFSSKGAPKLSAISGAIALLFQGAAWLIDTLNEEE